MIKNENSLIYVWDSYCGWCYGFSNTIRTIHKNHPELPIKVISGGLFTGSKKQPMSSIAHIPESNARISKVTGAVFGKRYKKLLNKGSFVMDSDDAAKGFAALRYFASQESLELASAMLNAFYQDGKSLSETSTYEEIAILNNLNPESVVSRFQSIESIDDAQKDFREVEKLGVQGFPTLLLQRDNEFILLNNGVLTIDEIEKRLKNLIS